MWLWLILLDHSGSTHEPFHEANEFQGPFQADKAHPEISCRQSRRDR